MRHRLAAIVAAAMGVAVAGPALAHPHVWVAARATVLFDKGGQITGIRHDWVFDEMYSAFATTGLGKDGKPPSSEELQPLAKTNVDSLQEFDYFTFARESGHKLEFAAPADYYLTADDQKLSLIHI